MLARPRSTTTMHPVLLLLLLTLSPTAGFPSGAPPRACVSMLPGHGVSRPQLGPPPVRLWWEDNVDSDVGVAGKRVLDVHIESLGGFSFKGFLLQARHMDGPDLPVGSFVHNVPNDTSYHVIDCGSSAGAVTHSDARPKERFDVIWSVTYDDVVEGEDVFFIVTIVQDWSTFWVSVTSQALKLAPLIGQTTAEGTTTRHGVVTSSPVGGMSEASGSSLSFQTTVAAAAEVSSIYPDTSIDTARTTIPIPSGNTDDHTRYTANIPDHDIDTTSNKNESSRTTSSETVNTNDEHINTTSTHKDPTDATINQYMTTIASLTKRMKTGVFTSNVAPPTPPVQGPSSNTTTVAFTDRIPTAGPPSPPSKDRSSTTVHTSPSLKASSTVSSSPTVEPSASIDDTQSLHSTQRMRTSQRVPTIPSMQTSPIEQTSLAQPSSSLKSTSVPIHTADYGNVNTTMDNGNVNTTMDYGNVNTTMNYGNVTNNNMSTANLLRSTSHFTTPTMSQSDPGIQSTPLLTQRSTMGSDTPSPTTSIQSTTANPSTAHSIGNQGTSVTVMNSGADYTEYSSQKSTMPDTGSAFTEVSGSEESTAQSVEQPTTLPHGATTTIGGTSDNGYNNTTDNSDVNTTMDNGNVVTTAVYTINTTFYGSNISSTADYGNFNTRDDKDVNTKTDHGTVYTTGFSSNVNTTMSYDNVNTTDDYDDAVTTIANVDITTAMDYSNFSATMDYGNVNTTMNYGDVNTTIDYPHTTTANVNANTTMDSGNVNATIDYGNVNTTMDSRNFHTTKNYGNAITTKNYGDVNATGNYAHTNTSLESSTDFTTEAYSHVNATTDYVDSVTPTYGNVNTTVDDGNDHTAAYGDLKTTLTYEHDDTTLQISNTKTTAAYGHGDTTVTYGGGIDTTLESVNVDTTTGIVDANTTLGYVNVNSTEDYSNVNTTADYGRVSTSVEYGNRHTTVEYNNANNTPSENGVGTTGKPILDTTIVHNVMTTMTSGHVDTTTSTSYDGDDKTKMTSGIETTAANFVDASTAVSGSRSHTTDLGVAEATSNLEVSETTETVSDGTTTIGRNTPTTITNDASTEAMAIRETRQTAYLYESTVGSNDRDTTPASVHSTADFTAPTTGRSSTIPASPPVQAATTIDVNDLESSSMRTPLLSTIFKPEETTVTPGGLISHTAEVGATTQTKSTEVTMQSANRFTTQPHRGSSTSLKSHTIPSERSTSLSPLHTTSDDKIRIDSTTVPTTEGFTQTIAMLITNETGNETATTDSGVIEPSIGSKLNSAENLTVPDIVYMSVASIFLFASFVAAACFLCWYKRHYDSQTSLDYKV